MYVPKHFAFDDLPQILEFIRREPFGILVSTLDDKPFATHVPIVASHDGDKVTLSLHVARANPQWKYLDGQTVLAIFSGPHAMISAGWYADPRHEVPTWNYSAVHCTGIARVADVATTRRILERIVQQLESTWSIESADPAYIARLEQAIVGIEVDVTQIDGTRKYGQNDSADDRRRVIEALSASARAGDRELAERMRESFELV